MLTALAAKLAENRSQWDDVLIAAANRPLTWLVWIIGISFAAEIIYRETGSSLFLVTETLRDLGILATLTWFLLRLIKGAEVHLLEAEDSRLDRHTAEAIGKLVRLAIIITSVLVILQTLDNAYALGDTFLLTDIGFNNASGGGGGPVEIAENGSFETGDFTGWAQFESTPGNQTINTGGAGDTSSKLN